MRHNLTMFKRTVILSLFGFLCVCLFAACGFVVPRSTVATGHAPFEGMARELYAASADVLRQSSLPFYVHPVSTRDPLTQAFVHELVANNQPITHDPRSGRELKIATTQLDKGTTHVTLAMDGYSLVERIFQFDPTLEPSVQGNDAWASSVWSTRPALVQKANGRTQRPNDDLGDVESAYAGSFTVVAGSASSSHSSKSCHNDLMYRNKPNARFVERQHFAHRSQLRLASHSMATRSIESQS